MRILVVDDEKHLAEQIRQALAELRYIADTAHDGEEALNRLFDTQYDLVILDIMLPKLDGISVLKEIRKAGMTIPVLMLTARDSTVDKINGLDHGADDYLTKPFSIDEMLARIRAVFRRYGNLTDTVISAGGLKLDTASREVRVNGEAVELTAREFSILEFLLYNKNRAVSRFSLAEHVWGDDFEPFSMSNFMDVHIKNLRRKLGDNKHDPVIRTVRGMGYMIKDTAE
ncbi:MAG: response regulator transcription factor [Deferribacterales bacterium]